MASVSSVTATFRITIIALMIFSGAINTIGKECATQPTSSKTSRWSSRANSSNISSTPTCRYFLLTQATTMFFGEALAFLIFLFMKKRDPETFNMRMLEAKTQGKEPTFNKFLLAIPAISDLVTSTLQYVALNFVAGSVYQMMRGGAIVTTFIFSTIFLKMKAQRNQVFGSIFALIGVLIVGASSLIFSSSSESGGDTVLVSS